MFDGVMLTFVSGDSIGSNGERFQDTHCCVGRHYSRKPESGLVEQFAVLLLGPFLAAIQDHQPNVSPRAPKRNINGWKHHFDE